jgi:hypothetical protein
MGYTRKDMLGGDASGDGLWVHCISRCVRRAYLCGDGLGHRKDWIEQRLRLISQSAAVEVSAYAVMTNHLHVVLRVRGDWVLGWDDEAVVRRYLTLFPKGRDQAGQPLPVTDAQVAWFVQQPEKLAKWRERLADLGWIMKALREDLARRCNKEDNCSGAFWEGRFKSVPLLDYKALIACMAYVDLNPVRAKMVDRPESSTHTGVKTRVRARQGFAAAQQMQQTENTQKAQETARESGLNAQPTALIGASPNQAMTIASNREVNRPPGSAQGTFTCWTPCSGQ